jgi:cobalt-zinc-cadmium efflux system outer membrane protein
LGVSVPLPVFNKNQGGISEAEYNLAKARKEQESIDLEIRTALSETYQTLLSAFYEAGALKTEVLPAAQHAFDAAQKGYEEGKFGYLDILDTQQTLFEAKRNYIDALSDYHKAVSDIERLVGKMPDVKNIN